MKIKAMAGAILSLSLLASGEPGAPELRIYTWSDYIAKEVVAAFEKQNECRVVIDTFDSNEAMYARLKNGSAGYDIVMPSSYQIPLMARNGMLRVLDHTKLPHVRKNFDSHYSACILDPSFEYSVPYAVTYTGFTYRKDRIGNMPADSWNIFRSSALKGRMSLLSDMRETIGAALRALGYSLNSTSQEQIGKAAELVVEWKKNVAALDNERYKKAVASGEWVVGHGYSSDAIQIMLSSENIGFSLPKEGFSIAFDEMVVPTGSKQVDLAHKFIDFCYDPDIAAKNMSEVCAPMPVARAVSKLDAKLRRLIELDAGTLKHGEVLLDFTDEPEVQKMYEKAWEKVLSAR